MLKSGGSESLRMTSRDDDFQDGLERGIGHGKPGSRRGGLGRLGRYGERPWIHMGLSENG